MPITSTSLIKIRNKGFTLIEIVMTILILGLTSLILIPYFGAIVSSPDPVIRERAISLGQSMMDEIIAKKWDELTPVGGGPIQTAESNRGLATFATDPVGPEAGEIAGNRSNWDDVDDFHNHSETDNFYDQNTASPPPTFTLRGYSRSVRVDYIPSTAPVIDHNTPAFGSTGGTTDTKRIIVTITAPNNETFNLVAVSCNF